MANKRWPADITIDGTATATKTFGSNPNGDPVFVTRPAGGETLDTVLARGATSTKSIATGPLIAQHPGTYGLILRKTIAGTGANAILLRNSADANEGYIGYGSAIGNPMMHIANAVGSISYIGTSHAFDSALSGTTATFSSAITAASGIINGAAGTIRSMSLRSVGLNRWVIYADATAESGSNVGSDLIFARYNDAGAFIGYGLVIKRDNGNATFGATLTCTTLNQTSTRETKNVQGEYDEDALSVIKDLNLHKFTYKNFEQVLRTPEVVDEEGNVTTPAEFERVELPATPDDQLNVGLLYDEVESNPYISTGNGSIQVNNLLFMALKAIQQLEAKNTELTQRIEALEG